MSSPIEQQLTRIPFLRERRLDTVTVRPLDGLTNRSFRLDVDDERYVLRVPGEGTACYLDRRQEADNAQTAADLGLAPELCWFDKASGVMVTRYLEDARALTAQDFRTFATLDRVVGSLALLHSSGCRFEGRLEPFEAIDQYLSLAGGRAKEQRKNVEKLLQSMHNLRAVIERDDAERLPKPCHVDPSPSNFLLTGGRLWLVDWEYAALCHPMWDLACLALEADLDPSGMNRMLERYFGNEQDTQLELLTAYRLLVSVVGLAWTAVQIEQQNCNADFAKEFQNRLQKTKRLASMALCQQTG